MRSRGARLALAAAAGAMTVATSAPEAAADDARAIVVLGEGADSARVTARVATRVVAPYVARDAAAFRASLASAHAPPLAAAAKDRGADAKLVARARAAARAAAADEAVLVHVRRSKRGTVVHVWLVDPRGEGGAEVDREIPLGARASADEEADAAWSAVAADLPARGAPAPSPAPSPAPAPAPAPVAASEPAEPEPPPGADQAPTDDGSAAPRGEVTRASALASVGAAIQGGSRDFSYVDRLTPTLRPYDLSAAPLVSVDGEVYPLARSRVPVLADLGATFDYAMAFGLAATDSAGASVSTSWSAFDLGLRQRVRVGRAVLLGLHAGYGEIDYSFRGSLATTAQLPGVAYRFVRGGLDARVAVGSVSLYAYGSYLDVLSTGLVGTYFARASVAGVEGRAGVAYAFARGMEISLEGGYTRFFYALNPQPGDAYVAGGALDQMTRGSLGLAYLF